MRATPEPTIISKQKSRANNIIVLVESGIQHKIFKKTPQIFEQFFKKKLGASNLIDVVKSEIDSFC